MFDVDLLKGYYTGNGVKIALIDTGVKNDIQKRFIVKDYHYNSENDSVVEGEKNQLLSDHGLACASKILEVASGVNIINIDVENSEGEILETVVCKAIKFAIDNNCEIINCSLGFYEYSKELHEICEAAAITIIS